MVFVTRFSREFFVLMLWVVLGLLVLLEGVAVFFAVRYRGVDTEFYVKFLVIAGIIAPVIAVAPIFGMAVDGDNQISSSKAAVSEAEAAYRKVFDNGGFRINGVGDGSGAYTSRREADAGIDLMRSKVVPLSSVGDDFVPVGFTTRADGAVAGVNLPVHSVVDVIYARRHSKSVFVYRVGTGRSLIDSSELFYRGGEDGVTPDRLRDNDCLGYLTYCIGDVGDGVYKDLKLVASRGFDVYGAELADGKKEVGEAKAVLRDVMSEYGGQYNKDGGYNIFGLVDNAWYLILAPYVVLLVVVTDVISRLIVRHRKRFIVDRKNGGE